MEQRETRPHPPPRPFPPPAARAGSARARWPTSLDLTAADMAASVELRHALDVTTSFAGLDSLLGDARLFLDLGDPEAALICLGRAQRVARLLGGGVG